MAKEVSVSISISAQKNGAGMSATVSSTADMTGNKLIGNVQSIGTTAEALNVGDMATIGQLFVKNLDATNFVEIGTDSTVTTGAFAKLLPGEGMYIPARRAGPYYAKANTASCDVQVGAAEA